ncbi:hypothetical protein AOQ84DRAFT_412575 [Glonium stellatum]|uniref:RelA/SpoT domain-containing protein n=1 Tax=Glonium stellatum TaxID=574774 RepID=A0A8E2JZJ6_9PEZI|nr:hypothetical protein AOQ84DRAFT_412575 [Glonium stellatum]
MASPSRSVVGTFMRHYRTAHHEALACRAKDICKEKLDGSNIQAILTYRAKAHESLLKKLENRDKKKHYENEEQIQEDIVDLAGVRIALYFPNQRDLVADMIEEAFDCVNWRSHPSPNSSDRQDGTRDRAYRPRFPGYEAKHAVVSIKKDNAGKVQWFQGDVVEIQIVTVLVHAWAEVEHDITYKNIFDKATLDEKIILDCLNGLVRSSELLLYQLHQHYMARITSAKDSFRDGFQLGNFLFERIESSMLKDIDVPRDTVKTRLEMLRKFLEAVRKDTQKDLGPILDALGFEADPDPQNSKNPSLELARISEKYLPFQPSLYMRLPFCIMAYILSAIPFEECVAQQNTVTGNSRCKILLSSISWLRELSESTHAEQAFREVDMTEKEEIARDWLFTGAKRHNILQGEEPDDFDYQKLRVLWEWFEKQDKHSIYSFVFRISKMGVLKEPLILSDLSWSSSSEGSDSESSVTLD